MKFEELRKRNPFNPVTELKAYRDWKNVLDTAVEEKAIEIARNLKNKSLDLQLIAETTGLSCEEVENL